MTNEEFEQLTPSSRGARIVVNPDVPVPASWRGTLGNLLLRIEASRQEALGFYDKNGKCQLCGAGLDPHGWCITCEPEAFDVKLETKD